ncbi:MAG: hypothetical protein IKA54_01590 [Clostridia bacterium]|nr:hypothetical protein [Clostridia bacterium]
MFSLFKKQKRKPLTLEQREKMADFWENDKYEFRTLITKKIPELSKELGVEIGITFSNIDFDLTKK